MKIATFAAEDRERLGLVIDDRIYDVASVPEALAQQKEIITRPQFFAGEPPQSMQALLAMGSAGLDSLRRMEDYLRHYEEQGDNWLLRDAVFSLDEITWRPPLPQAPLMFGLTGNSPSLWRTTATTIPNYPVGHLRPWTSQRGHLEPVMIESFMLTFGWTGELGVVLGRGGNNIPVEKAMELVAGFTIVNDIAHRYFEPLYQEIAGGDLTFRDLAVASFYAKGSDGFGPVGPWIVTPDEVGNPYDLLIHARQSGLLRNRAHTGAMVVSIEHAISYLSRLMTLPAGALVHMGAMGQDGFPVTNAYVDSGTTMEIEIERIGKLVNPVIDCRTPITTVEVAGEVDDAE